MCPGAIQALITFVVGISIVLVVIFYVLYVVSDVHSTHVLLRGFVTYSQLSYAFFSFDLEWPPWLLSVIEKFAIFSLSLPDIATPECSMSLETDSQWLLMVCSPAAPVMMFVLIGLYHHHLSTTSNGEGLNKSLQALSVTLTFAFVPSVTTALSAFDCTKYLSGWRLDVDPDINCFTFEDPQWAMMFSCAIPLLFVYFLGAPAIILLLTQKLTEAEFRTRIRSYVIGSTTLGLLSVSLSIFVATQVPSNPTQPSYSSSASYYSSSTMVSTGNSSSQTAERSHDGSLLHIVPLTIIASSQALTLATLYLISQAFEQGEDWKEYDAEGCTRMAIAGWIYIPFKEEVRYWELCSLARKAFIAIAALFFSNQPSIQAGVALIILSVYTFLLVWYGPYVNATVVVATRFKYLFNAISGEEDYWCWKSGISAAAFENPKEVVDADVIMAQVPLIWSETLTATSIQEFMNKVVLQALSPTLEELEYSLRETNIEKDEVENALADVASVEGAWGTRAADAVHCLLRSHAVTVLPAVIKTAIKHKWVTPLGSITEERRQNLATLAVLYDITNYEITTLAGDDMTTSMRDLQSIVTKESYEDAVADIFIQLLMLQSSETSGTMFENLEYGLHVGTQLRSDGIIELRQRSLEALIQLYFTHLTEKQKIELKGDARSKKLHAPSREGDLARRKSAALVDLNYSKGEYVPPASRWSSQADRYSPFNKFEIALTVIHMTVLVLGMSIRAGLGRIILAILTLVATFTVLPIIVWCHQKSQKEAELMKATAILPVGSIENTFQWFSLTFSSVFAYGYSSCCSVPKQKTRYEDMSVSNLQKVATQKLHLRRVNLRTELRRKEVIARLEYQDRQPSGVLGSIAMTVGFCLGLVTLIIGLVCLLPAPMWTCFWTMSNEALDCGSREWTYSTNHSITNYDSWTEACLGCPSSDAEARRSWVPRNQAGFTFVLLGLIANCISLAGLMKFVSHGHQSVTTICGFIFLNCKGAIELVPTQFGRPTFLFNCAVAQSSMYFIGLGLFIEAPQIAIHSSEFEGSSCVPGVGMYRVIAVVVVSLLALSANFIFLQHDSKDRQETCTGIVPYREILRSTAHPTSSLHKVKAMLKSYKIHLVASQGKSINKNQRILLAMSCTCLFSVIVALLLPMWVYRKQALEMTYGVKLWGSIDSWTEACLDCPNSDVEARRSWVPHNQAGFAFVFFGLIANCISIANSAEVEFLPSKLGGLEALLWCCGAQLVFFGIGLVLVATAPQRTFVQDPAFKDSCSAGGGLYVLSLAVLASLAPLLYAFQEVQSCGSFDESEDENLDVLDVDDGIQDEQDGVELECSDQEDCSVIQESGANNAEDQRGLPDAQLLQLNVRVFNLETFKTNDPVDIAVIPSEPKAQSLYHSLNLVHLAGISRILFGETELSVETSWESDDLHTRAGVLYTVYINPAAAERRKDEELAQLYFARQLVDAEDEAGQSMAADDEVAGDIDAVDEEQIVVNYDGAEEDNQDVEAGAAAEASASWFEHAVDVARQESHTEASRQAAFEEDDDGSGVVEDTDHPVTIGTGCMPWPHPMPQLWWNDYTAQLFQRYDLDDSGGISADTEELLQLCMNLSWQLQNKFSILQPSMPELQSKIAHFGALNVNRNNLTLKQFQTWYISEVLPLTFPLR